MYLLNKKAHGRAGARLTGNQNIFMNLMGLTDDCIPTEVDGSDWPCPIPAEDLEIFAAAASHTFVKQLWQVGRADGYVHIGKFDELLDAFFSNGECRQCDCVAHKKLLDRDIPEPDLEDIKQMIRTPPILCQATGNNYAVALLRQLFKAMNLSIFRPMSTGSVDGVSYVLLCEKTQYSFRGFPDYVVHNDLFGAGRILVATGEIQPTNRPDVQNSIYGVGSLLNNIEFGTVAGPIVCITLFKKKSATLSIARLRSTTPEEVEGTGMQDVVGSVTLKYVVSPSPMDLDTVTGLQNFAARLYYSFNQP